MRRVLALAGLVWLVLWFPICLVVTSYLVRLAGNRPIRGN